MSRCEPNPAEFQVSDTYPSRRLRAQGRNQGLQPCRGPLPRGAHDTERLKFR